MYCAYVCTLKNVRKHPNADRLQLAEVSCGGNTVCVDMTYTEGQLGVYFPTDGQLSEEFCEKNDLVRRKGPNGESLGGYLEPGKRNIRSMSLRGEKSDGLFMPLTAFDYTGAKLALGETVTVLNGHQICQKYIPATKTADRSVAGGAGSRTKRRAKRSIAPTFFEHKDTEQLVYNLDTFKPGDEIEITLKMHGTSQRTGYHKILSGYSGPRIALDILERKGLFRWIAPHKKMLNWADSLVTPLYDWGYVTGTRRTVLDTFDNGFYGSDHFRKPHADFFEGKLYKGETVYYEVVGFIENGTPIMASVENSKIRDKAFSKQYGKTTVFSYGCAPDGVKNIYGNDDVELFKISTRVPQSDFYVYRMTMTNEDGDVVEYTPDFMRYRCDQMGAKYVHPFCKLRISQNAEKKDRLTVSCSDGTSETVTDKTPGEIVKEYAERYYDGPDPVGKTHVREGVVCRIVNKPIFTAYKHKNFSFKVLEGIAKDEADAPDMEEAEEEFKSEA